MTGDPETLAFYDREGPAYAEWSAPSGEYAWLEKFIAMIPADGRLLDFGCGGGWAAKRMLDLGRAVDAFDGSATLAEEASRLTGINVRVMRFEGLGAEGVYAGIWASFCLLHAPRAAMAGNIGRIARALQPGGLFYLGLKRGDGETRDSLGRFYSYFQPDEIETLLTASGFVDVDIREKQGGGYDGAPEQVMHIFCRKAEAPANVG
ncbi:MAG: methyltransferase domain-containing protein [Paracoccaceae bacterium]